MINMYSLRKIWIIQKSVKKKKNPHFLILVRINVKIVVYFLLDFKICTSMCTCVFNYKMTPYSIYII